MGSEGGLESTRLQYHRVTRERSVALTEIQILRIINSSAAEKWVMQIIFMENVLNELLGNSTDMPVSLRELN